MCIAWLGLQACSQTFFFLGGGGCQIGQTMGPFMITRGLSCNRVGFGLFFFFFFWGGEGGGGGGGGGQMTLPTG